MQLRCMVYLTLLCLLPLGVGAQSWHVDLERQSARTTDSSGADVTKRNHQLNAYVYPGESKICVWTFGYMETSYVSGVGGLCFGLASWFELSLGAGIEKYEGESQAPRYAGSVLLFSEKLCSLELYYERGKSTRDYWYQGDLLCQPIDGFEFGIFSQRGVGTGPRFLLKLSDKIPLEIWVSPFLYDHESRASSQALGLRLVLEGKKE